jgi:CRP-like cAMP-binding protein
MAGYNTPTELETALRRGCTRIWRAKGTVLFRRGDKAGGMFIVLSGTVNLDFGVDGSLAINRSYGPGALVGLPATLTKRNYSMTATVGQNAELGFWPSEALQLLLRQRPELCQQLLAVLGERMSENQQVAKALLRRESPQSQHSGVA